MFIDLFIISKTQNQARCPSIGEWINKLGMYTMEYYSAINRNKLLNHENTDRKHTPFVSLYL